MIDEYFDNEFSESLKKVDEKIAVSTKSRVDSVNSVTRNISTGKKIRATLSLISFALCDEDCDRESAINAAAAIELIHNATLLHDDVVDDSYTRRGKKNIKSIFGNKTSVLTGDFILSVAFKLLISSGSLDAVDLLSDAALKLSEGELKQLSLSGKIIGEAEYFDIITAKTAILFSAGCEIASIITGKSHYRDRLRSIGHNIGISFQIADDLLDYIGKDRLGKELGNDFLNSKFTLPCIIAYSNAETNEEKIFWEEIFFKEEKDFDKVMYYMRKSNAIELSISRAKEYLAKAEQELSTFKNEYYKNLLTAIMNFITSRCDIAKSVK